ncbi:MAG: hypothetical protein AAF672_06055 [Pseudomonadota bacterium]
MLKLLTRHYKRLGLFAFGSSCAVLAAVSRMGFGLDQIDHLLLFAASAIFCLVLGLCICSLFPRWRSLIEIGGMTGFFSTLGVVYLCQSACRGVHIAAAYLGIFGLLYVALRSPLSRAIGNRITWRARHSLDLPYPPKIVWKHCVPGASAPADHCTGAIVSYEQNPDDEDTICATFEPRKSGQTWYDITFLENDAPRFCRLYYEGQEADGTLVDGLFTIEIDMTERGVSTLIVHEERNGLSLFRLMERWFDDALSFHNEKLADLLEARYGDGEGITKPLSQAAE